MLADDAPGSHSRCLNECGDEGSVGAVMTTGTAEGGQQILKMATLITEQSSDVWVFQSRRKENHSTKTRTRVRELWNHLRHKLLHLSVSCSTWTHNDHKMNTDKLNWTIFVRKQTRSCWSSTYKCNLYTCLIFININVYVLYIYAYIQYLYFDNGTHCSNSEKVRNDWTWTETLCEKSSSKLCVFVCVFVFVYLCVYLCL